ncbi:hypothetical protein B0O99DRAFT_592305 [Bisporella sp. PMI_857]|nr:hypothetical protein B0O99DRAFT_592305 [Bisporella sp. PMI_857]
MAAKNAPLKSLISNASNSLGPEPKTFINGGIRPRFIGKQTVRNRASVSRTGCYTCKKRHIKCDEQHPACENCTKAGWTCDYIEVEVNKISANSNLAPRPPPQPSEVNMEDEFYLKFAAFLFIERSFASPFNIPSHLVLAHQLAQSEPCLRHIVIGTAMVRRISYNNIGEPSDKEHMDTCRAAFQHYAKSIKLLQEKLDKVENGAEYSTAWDIALLASWLFVVFEALVGNQQKAHWHVQNGLRLLKHAPKNGSESAAKYCGSIGEIAIAFNKLHAEASLYAAANHIQPVFLPDVPYTFDDIEHAKRAMDTIRPNILFLIRSRTREQNVPKSYLSPSSIPKDMLARLHILKSTLQRWFSAFTTLTHSLRLDIASTVTTEMLNHTMNPDDVRLRSAHDYLMIQYHQSHIWLSTAFSWHQTAFDAHTASFLAITALSERDIAMRAALFRQQVQDPHAAFVLPQIFIQPLSYVAQKCRDGTVRRRVVALLENECERGFIEHHAAAVMCRWIMETEEEYLPEGVVGSVDRNDVGFVEERWRLRGANVKLDRVVRCGEITCTRLGEQGEEVVKGVVRWIEGEVVHVGVGEADRVWEGSWFG